MDDDRARQLLRAERARVEALLKDIDAAKESEHEAASETGDVADPAQPLTAVGTDEAIAESLSDRLAALDRAEARLAAGTYGRSIRSGQPIPDERLEADPGAELTVDEAAEAR